MREMTITEALVELKTLDSRINKAVNNEFVAVGKTADKDTDTRKAFEERAKASFASAIDLINERAKIKSAVVKSNAETKVKVGDSEMTVAEAIERKSSIEYEKELLTSLKTQYARAAMVNEDKNGSVTRKLDSLMESLMGSDKKVDPAEQTATAEAYMARNGYMVVDPINIKNVIATLDERIEKFEANVDVALSVSNARTVITIE